MAVKAQFVQFGPFVSGYEVNEPLYIAVYHYAAGTTDLLDCWEDEGKVTPAAQPLVGDAQGICSAYFDGNYKIAVALNTFESPPNSTTLYTWDNFNVRRAPNVLQGSIVWDPANLVDGAGETSAAVTVTGAAVGNPVMVAPATVDLTGLTVTACVKGADEVRIRIQNESGGAIDLASDTWTVYVFQF